MDHNSSYVDEPLIHSAMPTFNRTAHNLTTSARNEIKSNTMVLSPAQEKWKRVDFATSMLHDLAERPLMLHQYNSDEEIASPLDGDNENSEEDGYSEDDSLSTFSDLASISESLSESLTKSWDESDDEDYVNAETVAFIPVGKPKVVSLPSSPTTLGDYFDVPVPQSTIPAPLDHWRDEKFRFSDLPDANELQAVASHHTSMFSQPTFYASSIANSDRKLSFDQGSRDLSFSRQRSPSLPINFSIPQRSASIASNMTSTQSSKHQDSFSSSRTPAVPRSAFNSLPRTSSLRPSTSIRKLSSGFFSRFSKSFEPTQTATIKEAPILEEAPEVSVRPKMVARDASARAKPIDLPPCPPTYKPDVEPVVVSDLTRHSSIASRRFRNGRLR